MADANSTGSTPATPSTTGHTPAYFDDRGSTPEEMAARAFEAIDINAPLQFSEVFDAVMRAHRKAAQGGDGETAFVRVFAQSLFESFQKFLSANARLLAPLAPFNLSGEDIEYAERLAYMAHQLCAFTIDDPDDPVRMVAMLEGAKTLLEKSRAIMIAVDKRGAR